MQKKGRERNGENVTFISVRYYYNGYRSTRALQAKYGNFCNKRRGSLSLQFFPSLPSLHINLLKGRFFLLSRLSPWRFSKVRMPFPLQQKENNCWKGEKMAVQGHSAFLIQTLCVAFTLFLSIIGPTLQDHFLVAHFLSEYSGLTQIWTTLKSA